MKIVLLGYGNVAQQLVRAFLQSEVVEVVQIYNRTPISQPPISHCTTALSELKQADVYIIALPDDVIGEFSDQLPFENRLVVHTSGSVSMEQLLDKNRRGVFYPLQTFSKERAIEMQTVPICLEAEFEKDFEVLKELGGCISEKIVEINSEKRRKLHLAAVYVNNFTNHLYRISEEITETESLDFALLKPLIFETAKKMDTLTPSEAQTGPAKRKDVKTIENHLQQLNEVQENGSLDPSAAQLYELFTKSILNTYHGKKL